MTEYAKLVKSDLLFLTTPSCISNPMLKDIVFDIGRSCEYVVMQAAHLIESLSAELEQVKRERDAAVEDIARLCEVCVHCHGYGKWDDEVCMTCSGKSNWQWRGVKGENE